MHKPANTRIHDTRFLVLELSSDWKQCKFAAEFELSNPYNFVKTSHWPLKILEKSYS